MESRQEGLNQSEKVLLSHPMIQPWGKTLEKWFLDSDSRHLDLFPLPKIKFYRISPKRPKNIRGQVGQVIYEVYLLGRPHSHTHDIGRV